MSDDFLNMKKSGYSQEEAYFHKLNRELIEKLKKKQQRAHLKLVVDNTKAAAAAESEEHDDSIDAATGSERKAA